MYKLNDTLFCVVMLLFSGQPVMKGFRHVSEKQVSGCFVCLIFNHSSLSFSIPEEKGAEGFPNIV